MHCECISKTSILVISGFLASETKCITCFHLMLEGWMDRGTDDKFFVGLISSIRIIFLQETYSQLESIKRWEIEWGGKIVSIHGFSHSRGAIILFKPCFNIDFQKITTDNFGRFILAEIFTDNTKNTFSKHLCTKWCSPTVFLTGSFEKNLISNPTYWWQLGAGRWF